MVRPGTTGTRLGPAGPAAPISCRRAGVTFVGCLSAAAPSKDKAIQTRINAISLQVTASRRQRSPYDIRVTDPADFWSYVVADDRADGGRIVQLAHNQTDQYELLTGETITCSLIPEPLPPPC